MDHDDFDTYINEVAAATREQGGVTSKPATGQLLPPVDEWGFPKYPGRTLILPPCVDLARELKRFVAENEKLLEEPNCCLGTWVNPRTLHIYVDITTSRKDLEEARRVARERSSAEGRQIVALYNSERKETEYL